jgi:hypothetical protein
VGIDSFKRELPTAAKLRQAILAAVDEYCKAAGTSRRAIGMKFCNNPSFVSRIARGDNFNLDQALRLVEWLRKVQPNGGDPALLPRKSISKKRRKTGISR